MERVLITCDDANVASARTIERNGGVLEDLRDTWLGRTRRYWITSDLAYEKLRSRDAGKLRIPSDAAGGPRFIPSVT
jgi:hypothetical protein